MTSTPTLEELDSSTQSNQSSTLSVIARKLGHDLDEIRHRSLENLETKLDNNLITEDDVIHNRELLVKLLDILNSSNMSRHHEKCVRIIAKLMRWPSTVKSLILMNGLDILDKIRLEIKDSSLRGHLELIIDQLTQHIEHNRSSNEKTSFSSSASQITINSLDRFAKLNINRLEINTSGSDNGDRTLLSEASKTERNHLNSFNSTRTKNNNSDKKV